MRVAKWIAIALALTAGAALSPAAAGAADHWPLHAPAARPTDHPDPNRHAYSVPQAAESPDCTPHFCIHWVEEGRDAPPAADLNGIEDGDGIPDFVEQVAQVAEHVYEVENERLGWRPPRSDGHAGGSHDKTDVYLAEIGGSLFGYAAPDRGQQTRAHRQPRHLHGYLVLDNDYDPFEFPGTKPIADLEVTFAHEYNHILQFGYDAYQDAWFAESTATWMEDQVYDGVDDYLRYVRRWVRLYDTPITAPTIREYGSAVWNHWLSHRYGRALIRRAWAGAIHVKPAGFSVDSYEGAIDRAGPSSFDRDFARFARDVAEWRTGRVFREGRLYLDFPRQGSLSPGAGVKTRRLNHTTFQMLRVPVHGGRAVEVEAEAPVGAASAVALVGRIGSELHGRVISRLRFKQNGGRLTVRLSRPGRFDRVTAVLVNADTRAGGFSARKLDWDYLTETAPFRVRALVLR